MIQILLLSPSDNLTDRAQKVISERGLNFTIDAKTILVENVDDAVEKAVKNGVKIIISRGGMAYIIRERFNIPFVEIKQSTSSYVEVLEKLKNTQGPVAFFSVQDISDKVKAFCTLADIDARYYRFSGDESAKPAVMEAMKDGCAIGVGGVISGKYAELLGLNYIVLENSYEDIEIALSSATELLHSILDNESRHKQLQLQIYRYEAIFNYTHDGIIAIDKDGKVVVVNKQAEEILPLQNSPYEGKHIEDVLKETKLLPVLRNGQPELDELMKIGNTIICTNRVPIMIDNQIEGVVATFRDIESIQVSELKIRTNLRKKGQTSRYRFADMIGISKIFQQTVHIAQGYAKTNSNVLLIGDIGTGKEMFAYCIHHASSRRKEPFITVNCTNYTTPQLRMELLGYDKPSPVADEEISKPGVFELAHGGTVFLDKIGDASIELQNILVGIIKSKEVRRIGGDRVIPVDVRIIASIKEDPVQAVQEGTLSAELMYALAVLTLYIPSLQERENDYILLCEEFFHSSLGIEYRVYQERIREIISILKGFEWPGNIRQLMNIVERCCVLLKSDMTVDDIVATFSPRVLDKRSISETVMFDKWSKTNIIKALTINRFNITKAAQLLGCSRSTLYKKMEQFNIKIENIRH